MQAQFTRTEPYSLERLRKAIELFGKPKTPARHLRLLDNFGDFTTTYNLRARSSQSNFIDVDVRDDDSDSDFQLTQGSKRKRRCREAQRTADVDSSATCLVTLSLSSVRGSGLLLKLKHAEIFQDIINSTDEDEEDEDAHRDVEMGNGAVESPAVQGDVPMRYTTENVRTIETFFNHPIDCEMDINYSPPCEFCTDAGFGMFGLGVRTVEIIDHGNWYEELAGGHRDEGREPTRMCNVCARRRLHIINCNRHQFSILHVCPSQGVGEASGQRNRERPLHIVRYVLIKHDFDARKSKRRTSSTMKTKQSRPLFKDAVCFFAGSAKR